MENKNVQELIQYFRDKWNTLPDELQITESEYTSDLRKTVISLVSAVKRYNANDMVSKAYINTLLKIKERLGD